MHPQLTKNAITVLERRYLLRDDNGNIAETPEELFWRIATYIAKGDSSYGKSQQDIDALAQQFYTLMASCDFLPNSPTLMNAGKPNGQLSACFVLPIEDSMEGIFDTLKHAALIHQSGGGTGFSFSRLRPEGDLLATTSGRTSGPLSFMDIYNAATEAIKQGGTRRGANMGILRVDHPDIEAFITMKRDLTRLTNFNISVAITDAFIDAWQANKPFDLIHPNTGKAVKTVSARELMHKITHNAWQTGEPGLIFIDRINADNVTPDRGSIEATNPCGEVPLLPYEACNLGSINMGHMLAKAPEGTFTIDWERFERTIKLSIHFLDNVITQNCFPISDIETMVTGNRKLGLGLMGWADALLMMGIPYNSEHALELAQDVVAFMNYHAKVTSVELAKERGSFPFFNTSVYASQPWLSQKYTDNTATTVTPDQWQQLEKDIQTHGLRNATTLSLAPTGTISIIAGASGGIEPLYAFVFERNVMDNTHLLEVHPQLETLLNTHGLLNDTTLKHIAQHGSLSHLTKLPDDAKAVFISSHEITPEWHLKMQGIFQTHCDNAVSKTINFPESASAEAIEQAYELAIELQLKGVTVYRDNSRQSQPMSLSQNNSQQCPECLKPLVVMEGCLQCPDCRYAFCG